ncbi:hypothetical protein UlMin_018897 [Ulmus minor]
MVTRLLTTKLYFEFIKIPFSRHWIIEMTQAFKELVSLSNMRGNLTGNYKCRYRYPSVLLQVVVDHKKIVWDICVKALGGTDDATYFRDSLLHNRLASGDIVWEKVINGMGTLAHNLFDGILMKGRSVVVEAIGLLKGRWKILQDLNAGLNHAPQTIVACCVLHNIGSLPRVPDSDKSFYYFGENLRRALTDDLH